MDDKKSPNTNPNSDTPPSGDVPPVPPTPGDTPTPPSPPPLSPDKIKAPAQPLPTPDKPNEEESNPTLPPTPPTPDTPKHSTQETPMTPTGSDASTPSPTMPPEAPMTPSAPVNPNAAQPSQPASDPNNPVAPPTNQDLPTEANFPGQPLPVDKQEKLEEKAKEMIKKEGGVKKRDVKVAGKPKSSVAKTLVGVFALMLIGTGLYFGRDLVLNQSADNRGQAALTQPCTWCSNGSCNVTVGDCAPDLNQCRTNADCGGGGSTDPGDNVVNKACKVCKSNGKCEDVTGSCNSNLNECRINADCPNPDPETDLPCLYCSGVDCASRTNCFQGRNECSKEFKNSNECGGTNDPNFGDYEYCDSDSCSTTTLSGINMGAQCDIWRYHCDDVKNQGQGCQDEETGFVDVGTLALKEKCGTEQIDVFCQGETGPFTDFVTKYYPEDCTSGGSSTPPPVDSPIACGSSCRSAPGEFDECTTAGYVCGGARNPVCVNPNCPDAPGCECPVETDLVCDSLVCSDSNLVLGRSSTFTCNASTTSSSPISEVVDHYVFRYKIEDGAWTTLDAESPGSNKSEPLLINQIGSYQFQCRVCESADDSKCTPYLVGGGN